MFAHAGHLLLELHELALDDLLLFPDLALPQLALFAVAKDAIPQTTDLLLQTRLSIKLFSRHGPNNHLIVAFLSHNFLTPKEQETPSHDDEFEIQLFYNIYNYNGVRTGHQAKADNTPNNYTYNKLSNKKPAEQRDIFRPKLFYNYINLRLKNSQCTIKTQRSSKKRKL